MADRIILSFVDEGVAAQAELLRAKAPMTCDALLNMLPVSAEGHHAIYSGSEVALILPSLVRLPAENATWEVSKGDVAFAWFPRGSHYGVNKSFAELCWFYGRDARPSMWEGPVPVNVFARLVDATAFFGMCQRMRLEGAKRIEVRRG